jgi:SNF2 family DNA or RNA helicase
MVYFMPRLEITPIGVTHAQLTDKIKEKRGEIKDNINFDELIESPFIFKNNDFVVFIKDKQFIPLPDFYSKDLAEVFDLYGGIYDIIDDNITYRISFYFYKIKKQELINRETVEKYNVIFQQTYFIENNILDMDYHSYRLSLFFKELCNPKFLDLSYENHPMCKTQLYRYQRHNIYRLLHFHNNGISVKFNNNLIKYFEKKQDGLIYDFTSRKFITLDDIPLQTIYGGIVMDEPGTGKTLQFIIYLLEIITNNKVLNIDDEEKALILVPNDDIKNHWIAEFKKHICTPIEDLPILLMTCVQFRKYNKYNKADMQFINRIKIIIVDEIHTLWTKFNDVFDKLLTYKIKYRWGLSATPFITPNSLMNIIKFLTGINFYNERIANIPYVQNEIMKVFLKNTKFNTKDEYPWPDITIHDIKLTFDKMQQDVYDTEARTTSGTYNLRLLACQMELMFNRDITQTITPKQLKEMVNSYYKKLYDEELEKFEELINQLKNIHGNKEKFEPDEYILRFKHYENLIKKKEIDVERMKRAYDYYNESINKINKVIDTSSNEEIDPDEKCPICLCSHESPIAYFKLCGHYFCKSCIDEVFSKSFYGLHSQSVINCPCCRQTTTQNDIHIVKDKCDITASVKCRTMIELITSSTDGFIIFTQFPKLIDNLLIVLQGHNINAIKFTDYKSLEKKDTYRVIILSSDNNAAGIDLIEFNNVIIFEPFEDSLYCKEIEKQLVGRVHRIRQTKNVNVYRLIMLKTIEEQIYSKFI